MIIVPRHTLVLDQDYHQEKDDVGMVDIAPSHSCLHPWLCCNDIADVHESSFVYVQWCLTSWRRRSLISTKPFAWHASPKSDRTRVRSLVTCSSCCTRSRRSTCGRSRCQVGVVPQPALPVERWLPHDVTLFVLATENLSMTLVLFGNSGADSSSSSSASSVISLLSAASALMAPSTPGLTQPVHIAAALLARL
mgnify:CR=1 FL=1